MRASIHALIAVERRRQRGKLAIAALSAAAVTASSVLLLGLSGWFIGGAALAGLGGPAVVYAFNYMLPAVAIRLLAILRTGGRYTERILGHEAAFGALAQLRPALFRAIVAAPAVTALKLTVGDASMRMVQDVDAVEARFVRLSASWGAAASFISGMALLLCVGVVPACATMIVLGLALLTAWALSRLSEINGRAVQRANGSLKQEYMRAIAAAAELRAYGLGDWAAARVAAEGEALLDAQARATAWGGYSTLLQATTPGLAGVVALALSANASLPLAALAALAAVMTVDGANAFLRGFEVRGSLAESEARLDEILQARAPLEHSPVSMRFPPNISLSAPAAVYPPGTILGVSGPSGSGKSSLLERLVGLRTDADAIRIGGVDIGVLEPAALRGCFAYAPQDAALLAGTVRDNLLLARPAPISDDLLWGALHDAGLDERIHGLPAKLDAWIGENGAALSGGERRRLSLARSYLREAPWLLLDEPTVGLDSVTEAIVIERLRSRLARTGQGAILVSHRPAPLAICQVMRYTDAKTFKQTEVLELV
ncbi:ATP-binding cassette domain-containing protein [Acidisoma sp. L85]|uniref:ATP-binding cassette domain-containing protein n=1 Tax=Acidisoma sp. L85 TaxID=1641850 RepID=UPI00131A6ACF|nr:ATP-binding cassette domain-containing protein [Acidisoma sp. L85]